MLEINDALPCPFCHRKKLKIGSKSTTEETYIVGGYTKKRKITSCVRCTHCNARGPTITEYRDVSEYGPSDEAISSCVEHWNKR